MQGEARLVTVTDMDSRGSSAALSLRGLSKTYGSTLAVDRLDLYLPRGSLFGLVGPNGAGKTTTLSMGPGCCGRTRERLTFSDTRSGPTPSARSSWSASCPTGFDSSTV